MNWNFDWPDAKATIGTIIILCMIVLVIVIFVFPNSIDGHPSLLNTLTLLTGALISNANTVVQYYFGSSLESKAKGETLAGIATQSAKNGSSQSAKEGVQYNG
jgi:hypothetical protein